MKIRIGWVLVLVLFVLIGVFIYNFFNEGEYIYKHANYEFTMNVKDIVNIDDEIQIKYSKISNKDKEVKLIVLHNPYIDKVDLLISGDEDVKINKTDYKIKLIKFDSDTKEITLKVINEEI